MYTTKMKLTIAAFIFSLFFSAYSQANSVIVVQNLYFPKPGKEEQAYQLRLRASAIEERLGLRSGRVLKRENLSDKPYFMWECDFTSTKDREDYIKTLSKSKEFKDVEKQMGKLIDHFQRLIWKSNH